MAQQIIMAAKQINKIQKNDQPSLRTRRTSQIIFCWIRIVWVNWTTRFRHKINMHKIWIMAVSKTCRRQRAWKSKMVDSTMAPPKINSSMLLCPWTSFSWIVWIIREPVIVSNSTLWALAQWSIIQVYFEDILVTGICSIKIWKRETQGLAWKLKRWVIRAHQCRAWTKFWHSCIRTQVSGRDTRITVGQCWTVGSTLEASRTPSLTTSTATVGRSTQNRSNQMAGSPKLIRRSRSSASILQTVIVKTASHYWNNSPHPTLNHNSILTLTNPSILTHWTMAPTEEAISTKRHLCQPDQQFLRLHISSSVWIESCRHKVQMNLVRLHRTCPRAILRWIRASNIHSINIIEVNSQRIIKVILKCSIIMGHSNRINKQFHRLRICLKALMDQVIPSPTPSRKDNKKAEHKSQIYDHPYTSGLRDTLQVPQLKSSWLNQETTSTWNTIWIRIIENKHTQSKTRK